MCADTATGRSERTTARRVAKTVYPPVRLVASAAAGLAAAQTVKVIWRRFGTHSDRPPKTLQAKAPFREVMIGAVIQGAVFAAAKAAADRSGARLVERVIGVWPADDSDD